MQFTYDRRHYAIITYIYYLFVFFIYTPPYPNLKAACKDATSAATLHPSNGKASLRSNTLSRLAATPTTVETTPPVNMLVVLNRCRLYSLPQWQWWHRRKALAVVRCHEPPMG
ncbi:UNVERIFIED_CONTAM: hypothetical protein K2H54_043043 [Gekko kuhli]